ncbi:GPP34 family phosphoprotein [Actinocatenispora sera]|uniref:GPP34 family phosphoprotein n=1 Tax=Actinocatenispora sera TaxID=390989 RepID=UPI0033EA5B8F
MVRRVRWRDEVSELEDAYERERRLLDELAASIASYRLGSRRIYGQWGVAGELLRILTNPFDGRHEARSQTLRMALVAGVLAELVLAGWATCMDASAADPVPSGRRWQRRVPGAVFVDTRRDTDGVLAVTRRPDAAHRWVAESVLRQPQPRTARDWIVDLAERKSPRLERSDLRLGFEIEDLVADRLVRAGVARRERGPRGQTRLLPADGHLTGALNATVRIPRMIAQGATLSTEDAVIAALMDRVGLSRRIRRDTTYRTVSLASTLPLLPADLRRLVQHAYAAFARDAATAI